MSFWLPPRVRWPLDPGVRRENDERDRRQTRPLSSFSGSSTLPFVSPAKAEAQEPRWGRCHGMDLSAVGFPPARCLSSLEKTAPSCCGGRGGLMSFWLPPSAPWSLGPGLLRENEEVGKRAAQQPEWCRGHGADLSAVGFRPAWCMNSLKRRRPPCRGGCGGLMSFWLPPSAPWSLGPGLRRENDERDRRQTRPLSSFSGSSTLPFVSPAKAGAQEPQWGRCHRADLSAVDFRPAWCMNS